MLLEIYRTALDYKQEPIFQTAHEFANVAKAWSDAEINAENYDEALGVLRRCVNNHKRLRYDIGTWNNLLDLEEAFGTLKTTRTGYETMITRKLASVSNILAYTELLRKNKYYEER